MECTCASSGEALTLKQPLLSSWSRWKNFFRLTSLPEIGMGYVSFLTFEVKSSWYLITPQFIWAHKFKLSVPNEVGWLSLFLPTLQHSTPLNLCSEPSRISSTDESTHECKSFDIRPIEYEAIKVMQELDDQNLAWMIQYSTNQFVNKLYKCKHISKSYMIDV